MSPQLRMSPSTGSFNRVPDYVVVATLEFGPPPDFEVTVIGYAVLDKSSGIFKSKNFGSKAEALSRLAQLVAGLTPD